MTESSSDALIEALRKAVSRTSMLAEGNDPELDSVVRNIRQSIAKGADAEAIQDVLNNAEPLLIKNDEARDNRAKQVRETMHELVDLLEKQDNLKVPQNEKKNLEAQVRSHWQTPSQWPALLHAYLQLADHTLNQAPSDAAPKSSFFQRLFNKRSDEQKDSKNDQEIMQQISHTLAGLINNLSLPSDFDDDIVDLRKALLGNQDLQQLPSLLDEVINLIMATIGNTQEGLANYLNQLNKQLASINSSVVSNYKNQKNLSESREGFDSSLQQQVADTSAAAQSADNLESLKSLIADRMSTISSTMTEYRTQMHEQEKQATQSISQLRNKVVRMEKDSTSLRTLLKEKLAQAMTDALTDLPNRAAYQDAILPLCRVMQSSKKPLCLAVCDIDHFKKVNDTWGHLAGDKVLRLVPKQIRSALDKEDLIFRYGGEEFVIVFPNTNMEQAEKRSEAIRQQVEKTPFNMNGEPVSISVSIGISQLQANDEPETLFSKADKQLYSAKETGRNKVMSDK
ncbi:GGDEF domain-containing protein [Marinomonas transparens]|uniref:diguanylate cyclase n=1 Tax=Marinomonas transparens TaxID=2795388 RepID=A0A934JPQ9_9GAMM|nr:GGDEF domain-containing protein [Marinomonas transparens]MBJ7537839.1 GGDEF domain-containing protein [Marinomonas transparens]